VYNELDKALRWTGGNGAKKYKIKDFVRQYDFRGALLERLAHEPQSENYGLKWADISFVDRRISLELSYTLTNEDSD
jgi:hypothetical protein